MKPCKRWRLVLMLFAISCSSIGKKAPPSAIPIHFLACSDTPLLKIDIEGKPYTLAIDLGSNSPLMLQQRVFDQIHDKNFERTSVWYDIQGNEYQSSNYKIPALQMGHLLIEGVVAAEEKEFFITTGSKLLGATKRRTDKQLRFIDGKIGCSIFYSSVCFFDLSRNLFLVEFNMEDMKKRISLDDYIEAPFDFERGLVCIDLRTEKGIKKFMLDTGANRSLAKKTDPTKKASMQRTKQLQFESINLGYWDFYLTNFPEKWDWADGILGIDFFKKFAVCLDFPNRKIYLKKNQTGLFSIFR